MPRIPNGKVYVDILTPAHVPYRVCGFHNMLFGHSTVLETSPPRRTQAHWGEGGAPTTSVWSLHPSPPLPRPPLLSAPRIRTGWKDNHSISPEAHGKRCLDHFSNGIRAQLGRAGAWIRRPGSVHGRPHSQVRHLPAAPAAGTPGGLAARGVGWGLEHGTAEARSQAPRGWGPSDQGVLTYKGVPCIRGQTRLCPAKPKQAPWKCHLWVHSSPREASDATVPGLRPHLPVTAAGLGCSALHGALLPALVRPGHSLREFPVPPCAHISPGLPRTCRVSQRPGETPT